MCIRDSQCEVATLQHQLDDYVSKEHKDLIDKWLEKMPKDEEGHLPDTDNF